MRVLWFTNLLLLPVTHKAGLPDTISRGWVDSLRLALMQYPNLELGVASTSKFNYDYFEEGGTKYYNIPAPADYGNFGSVLRRWMSSIEIPDGMRHCLEIIERFKPDLIHIHGSENFYGTLTNETSIPTVISMQGILSVCEKFYYGGLSYQDKLRDIFSVEFLRGIDVFHDYLQIKKAALRERKILQTCKYLIGRTEFDKNFSALIHPDSIYYHCDEIMRPPFYSANWTPRKLDPFIIYCTTSASVPYKGLDCLLAACQILKTNGVSNIQIRIAGWVQKSAIWHIMKKKIEVMGLTAEVVWLGSCSAEQIVSELGQANVYVLPSYIENSPNSLAEAMLVGTPCIASNVGGVPSMITHGKDGLLFAPGDAYTLAGLLAKIYRDPELAKSLSQNAKALAQNRHDPQRIGATMMNIYSEVITRSVSDRNKSIPNLKW
jgi:glycosyltransferase involved in cell wall biosynthesis